MIDNIISLWDFVHHGVIAGLLIGTVCAMLGVFVILKRVVFIGIVLSQTAILGVAAAMIYHLHPFLGAATATFATVAILALPFESKRIPRDAVLGVIFVLASSISVLLVAGGGLEEHTVRNFLYGDIILTGADDIRLILVILLPIMAYVIIFFRPTLYAFLDREAAKVIGLNVMFWELMFFFALGLAVSAASKQAGSLLIFCYLVVTPAGALLVSKRLWLVIVMAVIAANISTLGGLYWSWTADVPSSPAVAAVVCGFFLLAVAFAGARRFSKVSSRS